MDRGNGTVVPESRTNQWEHGWGDLRELVRIRSGRQVNLDVEVLDHRAHPTDDFTRRDLLAEKHQRAIFESANSTEEIIGECIVISISAAPRQFSFERRIACKYACARTCAECFSLKTS